jgi:transcriptional regulator with XRE-family HTH domain
VFSNPEALAAIRRKDGHSQGSLAEASGVSQTAISKLERRSIGIRPSTAKKLAEALGVPQSAFTQPAPSAEIELRDDTPVAG